MNEDILNVTVRKFLKRVGITSQRESEQAVRPAIATGRLKGNEALLAKVMQTADRLKSRLTAPYSNENCRAASR